MRQETDTEAEMIGGASEENIWIQVLSRVENSFRDLEGDLEGEITPTQTHQNQRERKDGPNEV